MPLLYYLNCLACKKSFDTARKYEQHIAEHVERAAFPCMACGHEFETMAMLKDHAIKFEWTFFPKRRRRNVKQKKGAATRGTKARKPKKKPATAAAFKKGATKTIKRKNVKLQADYPSYYARSSHAHLWVKQKPNVVLKTEKSEVAFFTSKGGAFYLGVV